MKLISKKQKHRRDKMEGIKWATTKEKKLRRQQNLGRAQKKAKSSKMKNFQPWSMNTYSNHSKKIKLKHSKSVMKREIN